MIQHNGLGISADNKTTALISTGVATAGSTAAAIAGTAGLTTALAAIGVGAWAVPLVGPIIGLLALGVGALLSDPNGPLKVATTNIVNQIEPYLKQNLVAAQQQASANGGCLTLGEQATLIGVFNTLWQKVVDNCSNPQYGDPGKACIADRQRGGQWDWFSYYYDPIMAYPLCSTASDVVGEVESVVSSVSTPVLIGIGVIAAWLFSKG